MLSLDRLAANGGNSHEEVGTHVDRAVLDRFGRRDLSECGGRHGPGEAGRDPARLKTAPGVRVESAYVV